MNLVIYNMGYVFENFYFRICNWVIYDYVRIKMLVYKSLWKYDFVYVKINRYG